MRRQESIIDSRLSGLGGCVDGNSINENRKCGLKVYLN